MAQGLAERKRAEQSPWRTRQTSGRSLHCGKRILQTCSSNTSLDVAVEVFFRCE